MKQVTRTKLTLDRQTVRQLAPTALAAVIGGVDGTSPTATRKQDPLPNPW